MKISGFTPIAIIIVLVSCLQMYHSEHDMFVLIYEAIREIVIFGGFFSIVVFTLLYLILLRYSIRLLFFL